MRCEIAILLLSLISDIGTGTGENLPEPGDAKPWTLDLEANLGPHANFYRFADIAAASRGNVSEDCQLTLNIMREALSEKYQFSKSSRWAFKIFDSMMKIPPGVMQGGNPMPGSMDECVDVSADPSDWKHLPVSKPLNQTIRGRYCPSFVYVGLADQKTASPDMVDFLKEIAILDNDVIWRYDLCMPSTCSVNDSIYIINHMAKAPFKLTAKKMICYDKEGIHLSTVQLISCLIFVSLGVLLLVGTKIDVAQRLRQEKYPGQESSRLRSVLLSFSVLINGEKIFSLKETKDNLSVLHGIRFISIAHIVYAHSYSLTYLLIMGNPIKVFEVFNSFPHQLASNGGVSVETFFYLSGLLLAYNSLAELRKIYKVNWKFVVFFYIHRYWRLTPPIFFVIIFVFVWPLLGSGPLWGPETMACYKSCRSHGWSVLLYVQNLVNPSSMCISHSWFLACLMQLSILSPIILITLSRNRSLGLAINTLFILTSVVITYVVAYWRDMIPHIIYKRNFDARKTAEYEILFWYMPWCHAGPFGVGIFMGYVLSNRRTYHMPKRVVQIGWCLTTVLNSAIQYGIEPWAYDHMPAKWIGSLYLATANTTWTLGLAWMTFACVTGHGGIVNRFLSWKVFVPLSRISYMLYLVHPYVIFSFSGTQRERIIYTELTQIILILGYLTFSIGVALVASVAVEAPFVALETALFRRDRAKTKGVFIN